MMIDEMRFGLKSDQASCRMIFKKASLNVSWRLDPLQTTHQK